MSHLKKFGILLVLIGVVAAFAQAADKAGKPDATISFSGKSVAAGIGFSWGNGTLNYKGKEYKVDVDGLAVGKVGLSRASASGRVYGLNKLRDFNGHYTAVSSGGRGVTLGSGGSGVTIQNENGVRIHVTSTTRGADLTVGRGGVDMKVKK